GTAHESHELLTDGKPEPRSRARLLARFRLLEMAKQFILIVRRDARPRVLNLDSENSSFALDICADAKMNAAALCEFHGVSEHVDENLTQLVDVRDYVLRHIVADDFDRERELFLIGSHAKHHLEIFQQCRQIERR